MADTDKNLSREEILVQIKQQGDIVRKLKAEKASKEEVIS